MFLLPFCSINTLSGMVKHPLPQLDRTERGKWNCPLESWTGLTCRHEKGLWHHALPEFQKLITNKESVWTERSSGSFEPLSPWPCESRS